MLLFLSISIAIRFSSRFFRSINNLITASKTIGSGNLNIKVPEVKTDKDLEQLNKNFNLMTQRLRNQQDKLLLNERHEAWENVARKLAHEIKNPLTPIQLIIDRLNSKFTKFLSNEDDKKDFDKNLLTINKQIKQIENLVNEFSDFARMPKPIFKKSNLITLINDNINLMKELDNKLKINFKSKKQKIFIMCDSEQINRAFINLLKNSIESINENKLKNPNILKKIDIEINEKDDYIEIYIIDNGIGFDKKYKKYSKTLFYNKKNGTGLGLPIVNKIINDHNGTLTTLSPKYGAKIKLISPKMSTEILIIDDNPDIRNILNDLIMDAGYKTRVAANYNQALLEIDKKLPDVAIIDVKLDKGDNDGIELLLHIKKKIKIYR